MQPVIQVAVAVLDNGDIRLQVAGTPDMTKVIGLLEVAKAQVLESMKGKKGAIEPAPATFRP